MREICSIVGESATFATGNLVRGFNAPLGATGVEIRSADPANDSAQFTPRAQKIWKFTASGSVYRDDTAALTERTGHQVALYNSMLSTGFLYVACAVPFRGIYVDLNGVFFNTNASVLSGFYWDGSTWTDLSVTDNTASGGVTLAADNTITWAVPANWQTTLVNGSGPHFWARFSVSATLDSSTVLEEIVPLGVQATAADAGPNTAIRPVLVVATADDPGRYWFDPQVYGGLEVLGANTEVIRMEWLVTSPSSADFVQ